MKYIKNTILVVSVLAVLHSCSTKKDTVLNRNYHVLTTKFNVLFNGKEAFNQGIEAINNGYKDDYFEQLPIEPIDFQQMSTAPVVSIQNSNDPGAGFGFMNEGATNTRADRDSQTEENQQISTFDIAEEKAVKAVQKHSMNIDGLERNRQIDDAYLLLGKARYYSQRFVPAIEAFNYVIANYPNASLITETKIWRAKSNIRLENEEFAIQTLKLLLQVRDTLEVNLPDNLKEEGHTTLAMAYVQADSIQKAIQHLQLATRTQENRDQAARNMYVLGQIYATQNKKDSATMVFKKLASFKKAPYRFKINAEVEIAKNSLNDSTANTAILKMKELINDRDNRPYLDKLYYQLGVLHENKDSVKKAISYYNESVNAANGGNKQKSFAYENLGNIYFKKDEYQLANSYFDSVLQVATDSLSLRIRRVKRKHKNLASLIKYEEVVYTNDSILKIATLPKEAQEAFFTTYIEELKKKDEEAAQLKLNQLAFGGSFGGSSLLPSGKGEWYFYNNQSLGFGKTDFQKTWGNRKLEDNWRWSSKIDLSGAAQDSVKVTTVNTRYNLESYLATIPTEEKELDSLSAQRNTALYELGIIYKEQFKNTNLAVTRLKRVEGLSPTEELLLPINWHLYQAYITLKDAENTAYYKNIILTKYPETIFAKRIINPDYKIEEAVKTNEIENTYKEVYRLYKENKFTQTVNRITLFLPSIQNSKLIPKFELLKAYALGKYSDKETYKTALDFVAVNYPTTEEGQKAKELVNKLNK